MRLHVLSAIGLAIGALATAPGARAEAATVLAVTRGDGASDCPDSRALVARVAAAGSRTSFVAAESGAASPGEGSTRATDVVVSFERTGDARRARIAAPGGKERSFADRSRVGCDGLAEAVVLALVLSADGSGSESALADVASPSAEAPAGARPPEARGEAAEVRSVEASTSPSSARGGVRLEAGAAASLAILRDAAGGAQIGARVSPRGAASWTWSLAAIGAWLPASTIALADGSAEVSYVGGGLEACARRYVVGTFEVEACARGDAGAVHGAARGFATNESHDRPLFTGALLLRGVVGVAGPLGAFVEAGVRAPLHRERFAVENAGTVYDPPAVGALAAAGAAWTFR